jgi:hypothetical protein
LVKHRDNVTFYFTIFVRGGGRFLGIVISENVHNLYSFAIKYDPQFSAGTPKDIVPASPVLAAGTDSAKRTHSAHYSVGRMSVPVCS